MDILSFIFFQVLLKEIYGSRIYEMNAWTFCEERVSANAEIVIQSINGYGDLYLMIQNSNQFKALKFDSNFKCNITEPEYDFMSTFYINLDDLPLAYPINPGQKGGVYYFTIYNCLETLTLTQIRYSFLNSWGRLPFEKYPLLYICWIEFGFYLILFILCLINSIKHRDLHIILHYLILGTVFIYAASTVSTSVLLLYANDKNDRAMNINQNAISITASILLCIRNFCILMLSLFLVSGISIIYETILASRALIIVLFSAIFAIVEFIIDSNISDNFSIGIYTLLFIIFITLYILFVIFMISLAANSQNTLNAHIVMIYSVNIDPETTPSYRKKEMLEMCKKFSVSILFIFVLSTILFRLGVFYYFISYALIAISMIILLSTICWKCRLRYKMAATYCEDEQMYVINSSEQLHNQNNELNQIQYQYQIPTQEQNPNSNNQNDDIESPYKDPHTNENQLQQTSCGIVDALTNQNDDASLSSQDNAEYDDPEDDLKSSNQQNENSNKNKEKDNKGNDGLVPWEYGMKLPPMPKRGYDQTKIYPD